MTCPAQTGPAWKLGGEVCGCVLAEGHENLTDTRYHECDCGSWWSDSIRRDLKQRGGTR